MRAPLSPPLGSLFRKLHFGVSMNLKLMRSLLKRMKRPDLKKIDVKPEFGANTTTMMALAPLLLVGCGALPNLNKETVNQRRIPAKVIPGSFVVELKKNDKSTSEQLTELENTSQKVASDLGCKVSAPKRVQWENTSGVLPTELYNTFHVKFDQCPADKNVTVQILDTLASSAAVQNVEAEAEAEAFVYQDENDPMITQQYYLDSIKRDDACKAIPQQNKKPVVVAVVDSGVDRAHPDLQQSFYRDAGGKIIGANFVGKGADGTADDAWDDRNGHGTHVAGLVAATSNNKLGIAGVAACANVKIMPIRVMDEKGRGASMEIDRGIRWAVEHGADIVNLSLGSHAMADTKGQAFRKTLYDTIAKQGVVVFAAAGNENLVNGTKTAQGYEYAFPASYENVIAVAATDQNDQIASFSNRGEKIDIAAPGQGLMATYIPETYKALSGTSMATPVAAGTYAMALSAVVDSLPQRLSHDLVASLLAKTVTKPNALDQSMVSSGGVINAAALVKEVQGSYGKGQSTTVNTSETVEGENDPAAKIPDMHFAGLNSYQKLNGSISVKLENLPAGTRYVNLYWGRPGEEPNHFAIVFTAGNSVATDSQYYFMGEKILIAEAVGADMRPLAKARVWLRGLTN